MILTNNVFLFVYVTTNPFDRKQLYNVWMRYPDDVVKTQALSIKHVVCGCLEGIFAWGQLYVLISRVTQGYFLSISS